MYNEKCLCNFSRFAYTIIANLVKFVFTSNYLIILQLGPPGDYGVPVLAAVDQEVGPEAECVQGEPPVWVRASKLRPVILAGSVLVR